MLSALLEDIILIKMTFFEINLDQKRLEVQVNQFIWDLTVGKGQRDAGLKAISTDALIFKENRSY